MATDRQIQETIARCVGIVVFFHNSRKSPEMRSMMVAEVRAVAGWVEESGMCGMAADEQILSPVQSELVARYGPVVGGRLDAEFAKAFKGVAVPVLWHATA